MYAILARLSARCRRDEGSISIEYAMAMVAGVVMAGLLVAIVRSDDVRAHLTAIVMRSLP